MAVPRIPNAPEQYSRMSYQQILRLIQSGLRELERRDLAGDVNTSVGAAGAADALPSNPKGYTTAVVDGEEVLIPYYTKP